MFAGLEQTIISLANHMPLAVFAPVASFIEEAIPPIPSPAIMIITGFLASVQGFTVYGLITLCLIGSIGKTGGAWFIYFVMDKVEDVLASRFGKFFGVTHQEIEAFGARLGKGPRDYIILTVLRAVPVFPSTLISVGGGLLKIPLRLFLISTFLGSLIRNSLYIYLGYMGMTVAGAFVKNTTNAESLIQIGIVAIIVLFLGFMYYKRFKKKV